MVIRIKANQKVEVKSREHVMRDVAKVAACEAVHETLLVLGLDSKNPHEIQADMLYLNKLRKASEFTSLRIRAVIISVIIPAILYLLWEAIKS